MTAFIKRMVLEQHYYRKGMRHGGGGKEVRYLGS